MKALVAEDDRHLCRAMVQVLEAEGLDVDGVGDGADALFMARSGVYDILVLDITMPSMTGLSLVEQLRVEDNSVPVLFVTARDAVSDRVAGLNIGGDDYLVKPFAVSELAARVNALLRRRSGTTPKKQMALGELVLALDAHEARWRGQLLPLTSKEYGLLEYLALNKDSILTRSQLCDRLWGYDSDMGFGILDVHVHNLRKKLMEAGCDNVVQTVRGVGYRLVI